MTPPSVGAGDSCKARQEVRMRRRWNFQYRQSGPHCLCSRRVLWGGGSAMLPQNAAHCNLSSYSPFQDRCSGPEGHVSHATCWWVVLGMVPLVQVAPGAPRLPPAHTHRRTASTEDALVLVNLPWRVQLRRRLWPAGAWLPNAAVSHCFWPGRARAGALRQVEGSTHQPTASHLCTVHTPQQSPPSCKYQAQC